CFVIAVLALVMQILPSFTPTSDDAKRKIAMGDIASINLALKCYRLQVGVYPTTEQGLNALTNHFETYGGEPILERPPMDPWGTPYQYSLSSDGFSIVSAGPDKRRGTADDVR
ncbi:MAG: type II secretion system protein GspG, partial [Bacteroidota bacterium]